MNTISHQSIIKRNSAALEPTSPVLDQPPPKSLFRSSQRHKTTGGFFNALHAKLPFGSTETNIIIPSQPLLRKRNSQKKKTVKFNSESEKSEDKRTSLLKNIDNPTNDTLKINRENILNVDIQEANPKEKDNPLNFKINALEKLETENDIDAENLKKFTERFPTQRFTFIKSENSDFYKISTIREESDSEVDDSKKMNSKKELELVSPILDVEKAKIPKHGSKFLIDELFGEKEDSLDSGSNDGSSEKSEPEEIKRFSIKNQKKKKPLETHNKEQKKIIYNYLQDFLHPTLDNKDDIHENIEENTKLKKEITAIPYLFRQHTKLITKRKADFLKVVIMNPIERIHIDYDVFPDKYPLRVFRKYLFLSFRYSQRLSELIVKSKSFEILTLIAVVFNCITYILLRNRKGNYDEYLSQIGTLNVIIFFFFLIEMGLKMFSFGLFFFQNSYFKDGWNILDFVVNLGCFLNYTTLWTSMDLSLLRTFRVMKPLKTITSLKNLQIILMALFAAVPLLLDVFIILLFFFLTYAIAGLQLFSGVLKYRCLQSSTGLLPDADAICGNVECDPGSICSKGLENVYDGLINFDNISSSFLQVLFIITLDGWTVIMYSIQMSVTNYAWVYFISLVIIGSFVLTNLTLAVIKVKFSEIHKQLIQGETSKKKKKITETQTYDFNLIKRHGLWFRKRTPQEINKAYETKIPNIVAINVEALVENSEKSASKSVSKMSKNSRMSFSPNQSKFNSINPNRFMNKESLLSIKSPTFIGKRGSALLSKLNSSGNNNNSNDNQIYRASIVSHFEFEEDHSNIIKRTIKKTLTTLNLGLQQNFLRFFNYRSKQRKMPKKTLQKIQPKYLKLMVDFDREVESLSVEEVLPSRDDNIMKKQLEKQFTILKTTKLPIVYTVRKTSNVLIDLLRKVQEHRGSINTELMGSDSSSNDLFTMLQKKSIKSMRSVKSKATIVPGSSTKRSSKNLEFMKSFKTSKNNENNMILTVKKTDAKGGDIQIHNSAGPRKSTLSQQQKVPSLNFGKNPNLFLTSGKKTDDIFTVDMNPQQKSTLNKITLMNMKKTTTKKNTEEIGSVILNSLMNIPEKERKKSLTSQQNALLNTGLQEKNEKNQNKNGKFSTQIDNSKQDKERKLTKEQEVMFSLVVGKTKDVDYNFVSIMINATIENEDDDPTFLNELREDEMDIAKQYLKIRKKDIQSEKLVSYIWSGEDILKNTYNLRIFEKIFHALNQDNLSKFIEESKGNFRILRRNIRIVIENRIFKNMMILLILTYIIIAALEGLISDNSLNVSNMIFLLIFFMEFFMKALGYGLKGYFRDKMNILDFSILNFSLMEFLFIEENFILTFRYIRFLTAFKVLRITRLFYEIKFLSFLFSIISRSLPAFIYLALLFLILNFVYALVGMQLFGGFINPNDSDYNTFNFDTFWLAFLTVFDIVTLDGWSTVLRLLFNSSKNTFVSSLYVISWVFLGNFALLNLFLAILLDAFTRSLEDEEKIKMIDEEHKDIENEELFENVIGNQELQIVIPKDARGAFVDELTKEYMKYTKINPNTNNNNEAHILEDLIEETKKSREKNDKSLGDSRCDYAFFFFSKENKIRIVAYEILDSRKFKVFMIFILVLASFVIILETYADRTSLDEYEMNFVILIKVANWMILTVFLIEIAIKSLVNGFCVEKKSFMRSSVNVMDSLIVFSYFVELIYFKEDFGFNISSVVRSIRILRPLRFIAINKGLRLVANALRESVSAILNVTLLLISLWIAYGILGIILYRDRFGFCGNRLNFGVGINQCPAGNWMNYTFNFDNIFNAMITLFIVSTFDGWDEIMSVGANSDVAENGPTQFNNQYSSYIYFLSFVILVAMFMINLFIGVIFYNFSVASKRTKHKFLTDSQYYWLQLQKFIIFAEPDIDIRRPLAGSLRFYVYSLIHSKFFENFIYLCLIVNVLALAMPYDGASENYLSALYYINYSFNILFISEAILKIFLSGFSKYIQNHWNRYDFFVVLTAVVDIFIQYYIGAFLKMIRLGDQIIKGLRVVRIIRLLRLMRKSKGVEKLIYILLISFPMVFSIFLYCMLIYYIYIIFGCNCFKKMVQGNAFDDYVNFKNAAYAIMTLFKVCTADNWGDIIFDTVDQLSPLSALYFISFYILTGYILTNLFILVLLQQFENYSSNPNNPLHTFKDYIAKFRKIWGNYINFKEPMKIHQRHLVNFLLALKPPLGFQKDEEIDLVLKEICKMKLINDKLGFIYFNELLYCTLKRTYEPLINTGSNELAIKELEKSDEKTRLKLHIKKKKKKFSDMIRNTLNLSKYMDNFLNHKLNEYNPLPQFFLSKMIIYTWKRYTDLTFEKLIKQEFDNIDYYESGSDTSEEKISIYNQTIHVVHSSSLE